jgi:hypothetical protein
MDSMLLITIAAVSVAAIMSLVAWRVVREERRRSEARIAALAADIHSAVHPFDRDLPLNHAPVRPLSAIVREPRRHQLATIVGGAILVAAGLAALFITLTSGPHPVAAGEVSAAGTQLPPRSGAPAAAQPPALELVALTHERDGDRLIVRGIVRNPGHATGASRLSAVVLLFNAEGRFLTSGRVQVSVAGLAAGTQAPFVITVPGAGDVGRYRVSFRSDDRVVPHVDRRTQ